MTPRLREEHAEAIEQIRDAAAAKRNAEETLAALVVIAVRAGVPALHVAEAAGIGRATLYRWIEEGAAER